MNGRRVLGSFVPPTSPHKVSASGLTNCARLARRDPEAFWELYTRLAPMLLGMTMRMAGDLAVAARAVEEAFVRLWRESGNGARVGHSDPALWLILETRRLALQKRDKGSQEAEGFPPMVHAPKALYAWMPGLGEIAELESRGAMLKKVVRQLPKQQHEALSLVIWEGLTETEIAARLGEPLAKVQASLRAATSFLRHRMNVVLGKWSAPI